MASGPYHCRLGQILRSTPRWTSADPPSQPEARIQIDWESLAGLDSANLGEFLTRYDPVREGLSPPAGDAGHHDQTWANTARELVTPQHANLGDGNIIFDEDVGLGEDDDVTFVLLPEDAIVRRRVVDGRGFFALAGGS